MFVAFHIHETLQLRIFLKGTVIIPMYTFIVYLRITQKLKVEESEESIEQRIHLCDKQSIAVSDTNWKSGAISAKHVPSAFNCITRLVCYSATIQEGMDITKEACERSFPKML